MSGGTACECARRAHSRKNLVVTKRKHNTSAFNGGHYTPSAYSEVACKLHGKIWRTRAPYVDDLIDSTMRAAFPAAFSRDDDASDRSLVDPKG